MRKKNLEPKSSNSPSYDNNHKANAEALINTIENATHITEIIFIFDKIKK